MTAKTAVHRTGSLLGEPTALVPMPPKPRRRWGLFAASLLIVCLSVLASVYFYRASTTTVTVVAAARTIERGSSITRDDLLLVQVEKEPALKTVPGDKLESLVGQHALYDVAQGSLLTPKSYGKQEVPAAGRLLVSVPVEPALVPTGLMNGDQVLLVRKSASQTGADTAVDQIAAEVVAVHQPPQGSVQVVLEVTVSAGSTEALARVVGSGDVMVLLQSRNR